MGAAPYSAPILLACYQTKWSERSLTSEEQRTRTAYPESGHALIAYLEGEDDKITSVAIKLEGNIGGSINFTPTQLT